MRNVFPDTGDEGDDDEEGKHKGEKKDGEVKKKTEITLGKLLLSL